MYRAFCHFADIPSELTEQERVVQRAGHPTGPPVSPASLPSLLMCQCPPIVS